MLLAEVPSAVLNPRIIERVHINPTQVERFRSRYWLTEPTGICRCEVGTFCIHIPGDTSLLDRGIPVYNAFARRGATERNEIYTSRQEREAVKLADIPKEALPRKTAKADAPIRLASLKKGTVLTINATEVAPYTNAKGEAAERTLIVATDGKKYNVSRPIFNLLHAALEHAVTEAGKAYDEAYADPNLTAEKLEEITATKAADSLLEFSVTFDANNRVGVA